MKLEIDYDQYEALYDALGSLSMIRLEAVTKKQAVEMLNRARHSNPKPYAIPSETGYTPFDTGELRVSSAVSGHGEDWEMGYYKEYAPHVEYGHRTRGGGYVQGQKFLHKSVEIQTEIYKADLLNQIKKVSGNA